jgi:hypothetical protein
MGLIFSGCRGGPVYWKQIGPMSWSDDDKSIYFIYDNRSRDSVYRVSTTGFNLIEKVYESNAKISTLQCVGEHLYLSTGTAIKVSTSDGFAVPVVIPGYSAKTAFRSDIGETVFVAPDKSSGKDALWVQSGQGQITMIDPGPVDTTPGCGLAMSGDRKRLAFPSPTTGWSIVELNPPYRVQGLKSGVITGWVTNERVSTGANRDCNRLCDWDLKLGLVDSTLKYPFVYLQPSADGRYVAFNVGIDAAWNERVSGIAIAKPDSSDYRLILDGRILPRGPLSSDILH